MVIRVLGDVAVFERNMIQANRCPKRFALLFFLLN